MKVLITGIAGFIGFHTAKKLLSQNYKVYGVDSINDYYSTKLKYDRLSELGLEKECADKFYVECKSEKFKNLIFQRADLTNSEKVRMIFKAHKFNIVCHLAAQPGVRYSLVNPHAYINSNINGFLNILEGCRNNKISHLIYASSSSVYGNNKKLPFKTEDKVDNPVSLYAATKKSNELMAYTYSHLYGFKTTGLRFFTVYGPWGRPDMAIYLFADAIKQEKPIKVYNNGNLFRDFTYIDDIVQGISNIVSYKPKQYLSKIYNIGNSKPVNLMDFITLLERFLNTKAKKEMCEMQPGDVYKTWADVSELEKDYNYSPKTDLEYGIKSFVDWFSLYNIQK